MRLIRSYGIGKNKFMAVRSGRQREINRIRIANRAAAVGRLMLGDFDTWQDFLQADMHILENIPRRNLKSGKFDVQQRLSPEIERFCNQNFQEMTESNFSKLYEDVKAFRGIEMPLSEFEKCIGQIIQPWFSKPLFGGR